MKSRLPGWTSPSPSRYPPATPCGRSRNCLITPHTANTEAMAVPLLGRRIAENVRRFGAGEPLEGIVDPDLGY